ncbi:hypothetical protein PYW08_011447 [Mythimna loreyi]|uniref:Uncharacterized protein n=1 Tax=Mythimna loreyi TaxID=667449 RepID=A0ACC2QLK1_9NEOP|nr:hypothetical protein PYW08_011447 [Mythimna loreyi]
MYIYSNNQEQMIIFHLNLTIWPCSIYKEPRYLDNQVLNSLQPEQLRLSCSHDFSVDLRHCQFLIEIFHFECLLVKKSKFIFTCQLQTHRRFLHMIYSEDSAVVNGLAIWHIICTFAIVTN